MSRQPLVARRAEELLGTKVVSTGAVAGGDISNAVRLRLTSGRSALMKTMPHPPADFYAAEARGLAWLAETGTVPVPEVLAVDADAIVLSWIDPATKHPAEAADRFGAGLAALHRAGAPEWGAPRDGFIGRLPMSNRTRPTWAEFYAVNRVLPYLRIARDRGTIDPGAVNLVEALVGKLPQLVPDEPPARLHGDLWNGNCLWGHDAQVHVIDPAAYGGHREVDIAMLHMFGFTHLQRAMDAYEDVSPLGDGWEERIGVHQLFPLLVHACMFGGSYGTRAGAIAARYV
jgi:fructosamine-3-kinase